MTSDKTFEYTEDDRKNWMRETFAKNENSIYDMLSVQLTMTRDDSWMQHMFFCESFTFVDIQRWFNTERETSAQILSKLVWSCAVVRRDKRYFLTESFKASLKKSLNNKEP